MLGISLPVIFGAGILSFLSPCVLPLVPPYLTYMSGVSFDQYRAEGDARGAAWRRSVLTSIFFVFGFSLIFIALGASATLFGRAFRSAFALQFNIGGMSFGVLATLAGIVIILFGLHFLGVFRIGVLDRQMRHQGPAMASGPLGGFLLGLAFAVGWTPCIGPVLAAILAVASNQESAQEGALLLAVYSAGLGVPFILAGLAIGPFLGFFEKFRRHLGIVEKIMGLVLVLTGLLFITGQFTRIAFWFQATFPVLNQIG